MNKFEAVVLLSPEISSKVLQIEHPFKFQMGGLSYDESYLDIRKVLRFKKATWQLFFMKCCF